MKIIIKGTPEELAALVVSVTDGGERAILESLLQGGYMIRPEEEVRHD